ncbi:hypothetical protein AB4X15_16640 [Peribacillus simplex]|uniref:hypothetical protein n=1 Tax=Peribacillus TaxID=2675229 RepID=UPI0017813BED|nr:hypothetical protein [Brevibacillus sp. JNUCC-41]QOS90295.1 hypothetical protein JNUCC41_00470 [Brevibacillus sp. JNUCC-41]
MNNIDWVSIKDFPIISPEIDDSSRIQRATDTGYTVFFPDGEYICRNVIPRNNMHWFGLGNAVLKLPRGTTEGSILYYGNLNHQTIDIDDSLPALKGIRIEGIQFDANRNDSASTRLITLVNVYDVNIKYCKFYIANTGILLSSTTSHASYERNHNINIDTCEFTQSDITVPLGFAINMQAAIHGGNIHMCKFINLKVRSAIRMYESTIVNDHIYSSSSWNFDKNRFINIIDPIPGKTGTSNDANGMYLRGIFLNVTNNEFWGVEGNNIEMQNTQLSTFTRNPFNDERFNTVSGNKFVILDEHLFQGEAVVHFRNSHTIASNNQFFIDCTSGQKGYFPCITAKWGQRVQIMGNNFKTINTREVVEIYGAVGTYGLDYEDVIISNNIFDPNIVKSYGSVKITSVGSSVIKSVLIEGNSFKGFNAVEFCNAFLNSSYGQIEKIVFKGNSVEGKPFTFKNGSPKKIESDMFGTYTFYVNASTGDDNNARLTEIGYPAKTLSRVLTMLPKNCESASIIIKIADGIYNNVTSVGLSEFQMNGTLTITGNVTTPNNVIIPRIYFWNSFIQQLIIEGVKTNHGTTDGLSFKYFTGFANVRDSLLHAKDALTALASDRIIVENCDLNNIRYGISAQRLTTIYSSSNTGLSRINNLRAQSGGTIIMNGTQPSGTELMDTGGQIR